MNPSHESPFSDHSEHLLLDLYGNPSAGFSAADWIETGRREEQRRRSRNRASCCSIPLSLLTAGALGLAHLWGGEIRALALATHPQTPESASALDSVQPALAFASETGPPLLRQLSDSELLDLASDHGRRTAMLVEIAGRKRLLVLSPTLPQ
ncbi:MAG TPA: hypothetical protein VMN36_14265 [Verrucomicrobiales bacterium]|nr:hypothetical protein [Verrucomicrobiales bacterium]